MNIQRREVNNKGVFFIEENGSRLGQMTYRRENDHHIIIDHTEVGEALKGKGAGKQLVSRAVEWARENKLMITPECTFALSLFERIPEFSGVWKK
jgi:uncharacterized protein